MHSTSTVDLRRHFGTLTGATLTLYASMSGGKDWGETLNLLKPLPWPYTLLFLIFVTFAILALLNVVTAVFVGTALRSSKNDRAVAVQQELEHKSEFIAIMQQVFQELDTNDHGSLRLEEFEQHIGDEKIIAYLSTLQ